MASYGSGKGCLCDFNLKMPKNEEKTNTIFLMDWHVNKLKFSPHSRLWVALDKSTEITVCWGSIVRRVSIFL